ncbi:protein PHYTOCHROME KINASE SUBSTRATE 4 [Prunus yedoensis var. nudiflora]|uniref:Protein PHYTOCHROME KINASE SUBSTRATE 4 n=1 Tax=Prunus yedoensis var. nudiflora TaxID=2094558 RepID=A0A314ZL83_PRUYE|nr:protein PHYTOCHROME KINASE SUBSTRATE 4 [Prunus yedoensis var. nudiflora]
MLENSRCHLRDRDDANSFWSNLRPNVDHGQQQQHAHHPHVADVDSNTPPPPPPSHPCTDDQEISVFDAHKYLNNEFSIINEIDTQKVSGETVSRFSWAAGSSISAVDDDNISYSSIGRNNYPRARSFHMAAASATAATTPTASSEASWNSQTGLLSRPRGLAGAANITFMTSLHSGSAANHNAAPHPYHDNVKEEKEMKKKLGVRWFSIFPTRRSRRCPCSGKKSVRVVDPETKSSIPNMSSSVNRVGFGVGVRVGESITINNGNMATTNDVTAGDLNSSLIAQPIDNRRHLVWPGPERRRPEWDEHQQITANNMPRPTTTSGGFSFPILKVNGIGGASTSSPVISTIFQNPPNPTFTFPSLTPKPPINLLNNNINPKNHHHHHNNIDDDVASDASSDLFEIESFSTANAQTQNYSRTRRDLLDEEDAISGGRLRLGANINSGSDGHDSITSTDQYCYEPSEASIDWSVTTAEGFDRPSDHHHHHQDHDRDVADVAQIMKVSSSKGNNIGLLSCRREKAVSVGPNPVRLIMLPPAAPAAAPDQNRHKGGGAGPTKTLSPSLNSRMRHVGSRPGLAHNNKPPLAARMSVPFATSAQPVI